MLDENEIAGVWQELDAIDVLRTKFPARAKLGGERILVVKTASGLRGIQPTCPHQAAPMNKAGLMSNDTMIRCPRHNFVFRLDNGTGVNCRDLTLKVYSIREHENRLEGFIAS